MDFRSSKFALLFGAVNGLIFCLIYQPVKIVFVKYLWYIKNDDYVYVVLPAIYRIARDAGEVFVWTLLFMSASYTAHRLWATKVKSTINLWLRVAALAVIVPTVGLWLLPPLIFLLILVLKLFGVCSFPLNCYVSLKDWSSFIMPEAVDIKFEAMLFTTAAVLNFIYGMILTKLQCRFDK